MIPQWTETSVDMQHGDLFRINGELQMVIDPEAPDSQLTFVDDFHATLEDNPVWEALYNLLNVIEQEWLTGRIIEARAGKYHHWFREPAEDDFKVYFNSPDDDNFRVCIRVIFSEDSSTLEVVYFNKGFGISSQHKSPSTLISKWKTWSYMFKDKLYWLRVKAGV